jgi:hypothetical protein
MIIKPELLDCVTESFITLLAESNENQMRNRGFSN